MVIKESKKKLEQKNKAAPKKIENTEQKKKAASRLKIFPHH
jgi:hypothetical protein